jgi:hypothetical protein
LGLLYTSKFSQVVMKKVDAILINKFYLWIYVPKRFYNMVTNIPSKEKYSPFVHIWLNISPKPQTICVCQLEFIHLMLWFSFPLTSLISIAKPIYYISKQHDYKHTFQEIYILLKACSYVVKYIP